MTRKEYLKHVREFCDSVYNTVEKKSADYNTEENPFSTFESASIVDVPAHKSILTRTIEKLLRIDNLFERENQVVDEPLQDSIADVAGYMAILYSYTKKK